MPQTPSAESSRTSDEFDLLFPLPPAPSPSVFAIAGETALRELIRSQHKRLRQSSISNLFPSNQEHFDAIVEKIATFVVEMHKETASFVETHGSTWFRTRHLPITIDETARNVWLAAILGAFDDIDFPREARPEFWNWVELLSFRAITRRTMIGQPRRYPFAEAPAALRPFMGPAPKNQNPGP